MLNRRLEQLSTLRDEERHTADRIALLERMLDFDSVAAHARAAVARASLAVEPVPHLVAADVLPPAVYEALTAAIPPLVFFEERDAHTRDVRVPPRLAPTSSIVAWTFVADVVRAALAPALLARFEEPVAAYARARFPSLPPPARWGVEITLTEGRIVRGMPGSRRAADPERSWDLLTSVMYLVPSANDAGANSLLTRLGPADPDSSIPESTRDGSEGYTYEFGIGPNREGRRTLTRLMEKAT